MDKFEAAFNKLRGDGKTSVEDIIGWMKDTKLVEDTKEAQVKARQLFSEVADAGTVELEKFKQAIEKIASEKKKSVGDLTTLLADQGPLLANAIAAGASAFKEALTKKK